MTEEITTYNPQVPQTVHTEDSNNIVLLAMQKGYSPEFIEKMMELEERNQKNIAKRAYFEALAAFKAEAPPVRKDSYNKQFNSWYTSLGVLLDTYNPFLGRHGLSVSFPIQAQTETSMTVECKLTHEMGHNESIPITAPILQGAIGKQSGERSRNALQDIKTTFTYLRSATCEAILGVAGTEGTCDDDGNGSGQEYITEEQSKNINDLIAMKDVNKVSFVEKFLHAEAVEKILAKDYNKAITALKQMKPKTDSGQKGIEPGKSTNELGVISDPQRKRFYAIAKKSGKTDEEIKAHLKAEYGIEHSADIPKDKYDEICTWAEKKQESPGIECPKTPGKRIGLIMCDSCIDKDICKSLEEYYHANS